MPTLPEQWSLSKRLSYELGSTLAHVRNFRRAYIVGSVIFVLVISAVTWWKTGASATDLPMIFLASVVHLMQGIAIISLLFAWIVAKLVQDYLYDRRSSLWAHKEASLKPGISFEVPHWRFYIPATLVRFAGFGVWLGGLFVLLFVAPGWVPNLEQFIPRNFPF